MEKEISIDSLNIKIGGREISLSVAEAKKLKTALEDLFGKQIVHEHHDHWFYRYSQPYNKPYWGDIVYCSTAKSSNAAELNTAGTNALTMSIE